MAQPRVAIDVGGTFTDFVVFDPENGAIRAWKHLSTPSDPMEGIVRGLRGDAQSRTGEIAQLRIGTTIVTNAILERSGARVAYVTTEGFKDIPFIGRGNRASHYDMGWIKPKPLAKRAHCYEIAERVTADGEILVPLDEAAVATLAQHLRDDRIEAVAINFLFSYVRPDHERRLRDLLERELPGLPISISYEVLPKWKEYERACTVIADAYVKPLVARHVEETRARLAEIGAGERVAFIRSNGGEMSPEVTARAPIQLAVSGPTGGVIAAKHVAALTQCQRLVTLDMGGTSTDCSTVIAGRERFTTDFEIEFGIPIQIPMIDIRTLGAGGGSIAWIDKGGLLRVGPQSAGAEPGPACYGRGGNLPTVTDANLMLGRLDPADFAASDMTLDPDAAQRVFATLAGNLDITVDEAALAVLQIANHNMVGALRSVLVEEGHDPRDFTLLAYGGAGPLHANALLRSAGIPRAIIPPYPGQFSALGFLLTDPRVDLERTIQMTSTHFDGARATAILRDLVGEVHGLLRDQGYKDDLETQLSLDSRYLGQNYELEVPLVAESFDTDTCDSLWRAFHALHRERFGFNIPNETIEVVTMRVAVWAPSDKAALLEQHPASGNPRAVATREVVFEQGRLTAAVYRRESLAPGHCIAGPAVIQEAASSTIIEPGYQTRVDPNGLLHLEHAP